MTALLAFFETRLGQYVLMAIVAISAAVAFGAYERSIGFREGIEVGAQREIDQSKANANAVIALDAKNRKDEKSHQDQVDAIGVQHDAEINGVKDQAARDVAAARAGAIKLSVPSTCNADRSAAAKATDSGAGEVATVPRTELPTEVTANLLKLANDADQVVSDLNECRKILTSERKAP